MSLNIKLTMEFDGTEYFGWQRQRRQISIQEVLEGKVKKIVGTEIKVTGSGRTDSGVHALGYVANFLTDSKMTPDNWRKALNSHLPEDMIVTSAEIAGNDFNARFSARFKTYNYFVLNQEFVAPFYNRYSWLVKYPLNLSSIKNACSYFEGEHDFTSFTVTKSALGKNNRCNVSYVRVRKKQNIIFFSIRGDRFLHNMVRNIVGTLVAVGRGAILQENLKTIFEAKNRAYAGVTAPAKGLFLKKVYY